MTFTRRSFLAHSGLVTVRWPVRASGSTCSLRSARLPGRPRSVVRATALGHADPRAHRHAGRERRDQHADRPDGPLVLRRRPGPRLDRHSRVRHPPAQRRLAGACTPPCPGSHRGGRAIRTWRSSSGPARTSCTSSHTSPRCTTDRWRTSPGPSAQAGSVGTTILSRRQPIRLGLDRRGPSVAHRGEDAGVDRAIGSVLRLQRELAVAGRLAARLASRWDGSAVRGTMTRSSELAIADMFTAQSKVFAAYNATVAAEFDSSDVAQQLAQVALLVDAGIPSQTYVVTLGGFDTHGSEDSRSPRCSANSMRRSGSSSTSSAPAPVRMTSSSMRRASSVANRRRTARRAATTARLASTSSSAAGCEAASTERRPTPHRGAARRRAGADGGLPQRLRHDPEPSRSQSRHEHQGAR